MSYVTPPSVLPVANACVSPGRGASGSLNGKAVAVLVSVGSARVVLVAPEGAGAVLVGVEAAAAPGGGGAVELVAPDAGAVAPRAVSERGMAGASVLTTATGFPPPALRIT